MAPKKRRRGEHLNNALREDLYAYLLKHHTTGSMTLQEVADTWPGGITYQGIKAHVSRKAKGKYVDWLKENSKEFYDKEYVIARYLQRREEQREALQKTAQTETDGRVRVQARKAAREEDTAAMSLLQDIGVVPREQQQIAQAATGPITIEFAGGKGLKEK